MNVAILTSSRADYGIYLPLLKKLEKDSFFNLEIIAFGTHLSQFHGFTIQNIYRDGFKNVRPVESLIQADSEEAVSTAMGLTTIKFAAIWAETKKKTDLIFALGDRYEMFAAVSSAVPFNIPVAHLYGGETTLGAIDDKFRHGITVMSSYHFTSTDQYSKRVHQLIGNRKNTFNIGALSFDNLKELPLYSLSKFKEVFNIDLSIPTVLCTFHPETVALERNAEYADELVKLFTELKKFQIVITMPNADTMGSLIREKFDPLIQQNNHIIGIENFGTLGYLSCMKHCSFMLGNTSSGMVEAAFFPTPVINIGDRQSGRILGEHIISSNINADEMLEAIDKVEAVKTLKPDSLYGNGNSANMIISYLKNISLRDSNI